MDLSPSGRRPCKSVVKRKQNSPDARYGGARKNEYRQISQLATCASRRWFLPFAEPDIHLLSPAWVGLLRRLSLCSPPVPKQSEGSLGSLISSAQSATCGTWQPARRVILISFSHRPGVSKPPPCFSLGKERSPFLGDPRPADTRPSFGPRLGSPGWRYPSASRVHGVGPARGCAGEPILPLR